MEFNIFEFEENVEINQIKSINIFNNLKNDYFLQKVFNNLQKEKSLNIIKYNKNIKKKININIKDYKEYSELYSSIEVEIKPVKNEFGNFFNIKNEEEIYLSYIF